MLLLRSTFRRVAVTAVVALTVTACADSPTAVGPEAGVALTTTIADDFTDTTYSSGALPADPFLWFRRVWVCKVGASANFELSINGAAATTVALEDDQCLQVHYYAPNWHGGSSDPEWTGEDTVTVTEVLDNPLMQLDSIVRDSTHGAGKVRLSTLTNTNTVTVVINRSKGSILTFFNSVTEQPTVSEGCTPGYWKQRHHKDSWRVYSPHQKFSSVFENAFPGKTLYEVLRLQGGGLNALGRHAVAALLNSAHPDVNYGIDSPADVIAEFNEAYEGRTERHYSDWFRSRYRSRFKRHSRSHNHHFGCGHASSYVNNRDEIAKLKDEFEAYNEAGCPLN